MEYDTFKTKIRGEWNHFNGIVSITSETVVVKQLVAVVTKIDILYERLFKDTKCYEFSF